MTRVENNMSNSSLTAWKKALGGKGNRSGSYSMGKRSFPIARPSRGCHDERESIRQPKQLLGIGKCAIGQR